MALFAPSGIAKSGTADIPFVGKISRALQVRFFFVCALEMQERSLALQTLEIPSIDEVSA